MSEKKRNFNEPRKSMGEKLPGVAFPVPPAKSEMSDTYKDFLQSLKEQIKKERLSIVLKANVEMNILYWKIGRAILQKQNEEGWGAKVIDRISRDLQESFPDMKGFSPRNIKYMRKFAECWTDEKRNPPAKPAVLHRRA